MQGKTSTVIAHRFATVRRADMIFVSDTVRVVGQGPHEELLGRGVLYSRLYELHSGGEEIATRGNS